MRNSVNSQTAEPCQQSCRSVNGSFGHLQTGVDKVVAVHDMYPVATECKGQYIYTESMHLHDAT
jgi:hypothetical protein